MNRRSFIKRIAIALGLAPLIGMLGWDDPPIMIEIWYHDYENGANELIYKGPLDDK